ncbi:O-antigen ligase family protein [Winogradskyella alexanderae]|uniref:O-antigen ligase-related domain-containing protein n=1 Tax=Winogradskyella alexanderae TaxID=2877123 RepID=A0ABS7XMT3_9FLAO|nr:O-antigen ligase family protein [Winogradskyella alexanderae]MCA0131298.1 hypothetical protein [Winogradskyella alexanderae]
MIKNLEENTKTQIIGYLVFMTLGSLLLRGSFFSALFNGILIVTLLVFLKWKINKIDFKEFVLLSILFLPTLIGFLYSEDRLKAIEFVYRSAPLILIPYLYLKTDTKAILNGFSFIEKYLPLLTVSVFLGYIIIGYYYFRTGLGDFLYYSNFSRLTDIHPTYAGCIVNLALIFWLKNYKTHTHVIYRAVVVLSFILILFVIGSKATIFIALIITGWFTFTSKISLFTRLFLIATPFFLLILFKTNIENRLSDKKLESNENINTIELLNNLYDNDIKPRVLLWKSNIATVSGLEIIFGKGTIANEEDRLKQYKKNGLTYATENKYNAHNQYVEIYYHYGLFGVLAFLVHCIFMIRIIIASKESYYLLIFSSFLFYFLFESLLVRSFGIIVYAFAISYIYIKVKNAKNLPT